MVERSEFELPVPLSKLSDDSVAATALTNDPTALARSCHYPVRSDSLAERGEFELSGDFIGGQ
jgi:hypothetical protein